MMSEFPTEALAGSEHAAATFWQPTPLIPKDYCLQMYENKRIFMPFDLLNYSETYYDVLWVMSF